MKVALIGVGNMGSAMVKAWLRAGAIDPANLTLFDVDPEKMGEFHLSAESTLVNDRICESEIVVLAIKPQDLRVAAESLRPLISTSAIILSVLAGTSIKKISANFPEHVKIVRSMPNMGARICQAMTGYVVTSAVTNEEKANIAKLLNAFGPSQLLSSEDYMDAWCGVAGSGPGFVVALMQGFVEAAIKQGFAPEVAEKMVKQTFYGTAALVHESKLSLEEVRKTVTSKGGTTAAGLDVMETRKMSDLINEVVEAATRRGRELNEA